jgi:hypothetical protein
MRAGALSIGATQNLVVPSPGWPLLLLLIIKIYENIGLSDFTPAPVTRVVEMLRLRSYFMSQLGPLYLWIIKLSMIEWPTLSAQEKKVHAAMRKSFVTSYAFEAIIQHWLWKTLKNATQSFGPLFQVFATDYDATTTCGTDAWESIFTLFPRAGAAITHQRIVSGFEQCMSIKDDSTTTRLIEASNVIGTETH